MFRNMFGFLGYVQFLFCAVKIYIASTFSIKDRNTLFSIYMYIEEYFSYLNQVESVEVVYVDRDSVFVVYSEFWLFSYEYYSYL